MSVKKAIALIALLAILIFTALVIINQFYPNPYTQGIYTFITVTVPAYLSDKLEVVLVSGSAILGIIGGASKKIGKVRDEASAQVSAIEEEKNKAQSQALSQVENVQELQEKNTALEERIKGMEANRSEAEKLVVQQQAEIKRLEKDLDKANEKLSSVPYREVVKYK